MELITLKLIIIFTFGSAVEVVYGKTCLRSSLALLCVFLGLSSYWAVVGLVSLSLIIIIVYVGAVMVFCIFVIMMVGEIHEENELLRTSSIFFYVLCLILVYYVGDYDMEFVNIELIDFMDEISPIELTGLYLFNERLFLVISVGLLLLIAIFLVTYMYLVNNNKWRR